MVVAVGAIGAVAVAVLALARGESINALWIVLGGLCAAAISYRFYSKWLATKVLVLNDDRATPALVVDDLELHPAEEEQPKLPVVPPPDLTR